MTNTKTKKSAKQKKVLIASILLAGLIAAGGTFAWFTSQDEVTNKLTASNNYGVSIVEDFTPPEDWTPGQDVNKDVFVTNTGNVDAFVKVAISNNIDLKTVAVSTEEYTDANIADYVELSTSGDEVKSIQAGGRVVCKAGTTITSENEIIEDGTNFTPTAAGLYVFERESNYDTGTRTWVYDGYYFNGTDKYYDVEVTKEDAGDFTYKMMKTSSINAADLALDYSQLTDGNDTTNTIVATYSSVDSSTDDDIVINIKLYDNWATDWTFDDTNKVFYYNNTLKAGKTTENKLIDSVELDKNVSNKAYQSFDYYLNIVADSVQVVKNEAGEDTNEAVEADTTTWTLKPTLTLGAEGTTTAVSWAVR
ncbi:MAG: BsaA family SipW-dependent biofilm matrix protein [Oscillospiraceae bacterium]